MIIYLKTGIGFARLCEKRFGKEGIMRKGIMVYGRYVSVVLRSAMQYRLSFF